MAFSFKDVEIPQSNQEYVVPGFWKLAPIKAELVEKEDRTPYMAVTFEGERGKMVEKFWLSEKAMGRLQYLHAGLYNKKLEKEFKTAAEVVAYFNKLFESKRIEVPLVIGGTRNSAGRVYVNLPYSDFIINDERFEEGPFEEGSSRYNSVVRDEVQRDAPKTDRPILDDDGDKLPWEE